jgi:hypothetical protein
MKSEEQKIAHAEDLASIWESVHKIGEAIKNSGLESCAIEVNTIYFRITQYGKSFFKEDQYYISRLESWNQPIDITPSQALKESVAGKSATVPGQLHNAKNESQE